MRNSTKSVFLIFSIFLSIQLFGQDFGQFGTGVHLTVNQQAAFYKLSGNVNSSTNFQSLELGTFNEGDGNLLLDGARLLSWKSNSGNFCGGSLNYTIYKDGDRVEPSSWPTIDINYKSNCPFPSGYENCSGNDQLWETTTNAAIDLTNRAPGRYVLEVFVSYTGSTSGGGCGTSGYDNNSGSATNYTAFFDISRIGLPTLNETSSFTLTFDAEGSALEASNKVYLHSGVALDPSKRTSFDETVGNWGQDDAVGEMTSLGDDKWSITISSLQSYFSLTANEDIFGFNFLFRNADGSLKEDKSGSNYSKDVSSGDYLVLHSPPVGETTLVESGASSSITANVYDDADDALSGASWTLIEVDPINGDTPITDNTNLDFSYDYLMNDTEIHHLRLSAVINAQTKTKDFYLQGYNTPTLSALPAGAKPGINYDPADNTKATLVLHTPTSTSYKKGNGTVSGAGSTAAKDVVHILGDFNSWEISESYKMKKDGDYWWLTIENLAPGTDYVFQYLIDGELQIGDPYTQQVSDSDDQYISASVYPNLPSYPSEASGRASVLNTERAAYTWLVNDFTAPASNELNIYELHFRDFTDEGTYLAAIDKLDYLQQLGINAIHVLPVSEFEGNSSWGYNPNYYMAADKAYGPDTDLKKFIDEAHSRDIAVFNDMVFNHAFGSNPMVLMYWDEANSRPSADNPWFNAEHRAVYTSDGHWGNDWNHESEHTQQFVDSVLFYWLDEFRFDGFRFDFTKGFTQTAGNPNDVWASAPDTDRQGLLLRMVNKMWTNKLGSIAIFEHLAQPSEDKILADAGILMWSGVGHHNQVKNLNLGYTTDNIDIYTTGVFNSSQWGFTYANLISYAESHDEERQAYEMFNYGNIVKDIVDPDEKIAAGVERLKSGLAFNLMFPGPRMLWQFQELAYDYSINYNGRTGEKPVKWEYFDDDNRRELYILASQLLTARLDHNWYSTSVDYTNLGSGTDFGVKRMSLSDGAGNYMVIVSNPNVSSAQSFNPSYATIGTWYQNNGDNSFKNLSYQVSATGDQFTIAAGQTLVLTNFILPSPSEDDTDGDGVLDLYDECPSTPSGAQVNANGCAACDDGNGNDFTPLTWYADTDGDTYGDSGSTTTACVQPNGYVSNDTDCNDNDIAINPGTVWYADADGDGYGDASISLTQCTQPSGFVLDNTDCDDTDEDINPQTIWYADTDGDTYGDSGSTTIACVQPNGYVSNDTDCNDNDIAINPGTVWYADADGDTYGDAGTSLTQCVQPSGYVLNDSDLCLSTPNGEQVDGNGCSLSQLDTDSDGIFDDVDNCVSTANANQLDIDEDGVGDVCDSEVIWYNNAWSNGTGPIAGDDVIVSADLTMTDEGTVSINNLEVIVGATLEIAGVTYLDVDGDLINNGAVNIRSGASLYTNPSGSVSDNITIERNTRYSDGRYSFVGSPVESDPSITGTDLGAFVYKYDETQAYGSDGLARWIGASNAVLETGRGYTQAKKGLISFTGKPNAGTLTYDASFTDRQDANDGWNLIANPYPSAIIVEEFLVQNSSILENAVYIWDDNGSDQVRGTNSDYIVANGSMFTQNSTAGNGSRYNGKLGTSQGFFVKLKGPSNQITFNESMRAQSDNADANFFRTNKNLLPFVGLYLTNSEGINKSFALGWTREASDDVMNDRFDAPVFNASGFSFFSVKGNDLLSLCAITSNLKEVPIGYTASEAGTYAISIDKTYFADKDLWLLDNLTGERVSLNDGNYSFNSDMGTFLERFLIVTSPDDVLSLPQAKWQAYSFDQTLVIKNAKAEWEHYKLFDMLGRHLLSFDVEEQRNFNLDQLEHGIYVLTDGHQSQRILIQKK